MIAKDQEHQDNQPDETAKAAIKTTAILPAPGPLLISI
jgi:hypothetical protein